MEKKSTQKGMGAVIALAVVIVVAVVILTVAVANVIKDSGGSIKKENTTLYTLAGVTNTTKENNLQLEWENSQSSDATDESKEAVGNVQEEAGDAVTTPPTTKKADTYDPIAEYEKLTKNGENKLSDHHNNKFIKLVADKYGVDKELIVAIYSEPDTGNNFVLEFSGKRDEDGNVIKSPDTLTKVYSIDKNKNISVATGKTSGNIGVSYAEGTLCFNMMKTIVMPQYPEYFTGVEK